MLTTFSWVPKGAMKAQPIFSTDTLEQARMKLRRQNPLETEEEEQARNAPAQAASAHLPNTVDDDNDEDANVNDTLRDIAGGGAGAIVEQVESEDEDELDDTNFKETDLVFAVASADPAAPRLELYTYDEPEDNLFLHHDAEISAFPLCSSWLTDGDMSMLAIGTMLPFVEIWALDVMDSVEPAIILGGCEKAEHNYNKKTLRRHLKADSHTDAVLAVEWNTIAQHIIASGSADQTIKLWDLNEGGRCLGTYREAEKVQSLNWHRTEANWLLSGGFDANMVLRDCRAPDQPALRFVLDDVVERVEFSPVGRLLLASTSSGGWAAFESRMNAQPLWQLHPHDGETTFSCSRQVPGLYATGGKDGLIALWDGRAAGEPPRQVVKRAYRTGAVLSMEFHPNSPHILGACGASGEPLVYTITGDIQSVFR